MRKRDHFLPLDGVLTVYTVTNDAPPGRQPVRKIEAVYRGIRYEERRVGYRQQYAAQQEGQRVDTKIRIPAGVRMGVEHMVELSDGKLYEVLTVEKYFPARGECLLDLSLRRFKGEVIRSDEL